MTDAELNASKTKCYALALLRVEELERETGRLLDLIREFNHIAPDLAQLLDGWHCDVAWTEWDTSVRQRLSALQQKTDPLTR